MDGNRFIAIFPVVDLYTKIQHNFELEVVSYFLSKYEADIDPRFTIPFVLESINFILTRSEK